VHHAARSAASLRTATAASDDNQRPTRAAVALLLRATRKHAAGIAREVSYGPEAPGHPNPNDSASYQTHVTLRAGGSKVAA